MSTWYAQTDYPKVIQGIAGKYTIGQIGCFNTSFCNLLRRFGKDINPVQFNDIFKERGLWIDADDGIRDDLGWASITAFDGQVHVTATGAGGWPPTNNAIVKFHYQSISQPWISRNGQRVANMIDHFCLVADEHAHTIIDSWDGKIKTPGAYGEPVGWASYENMVPQPVNTPLPVPTPVPGTTYIFAKGDTVWEVARRTGFTVAELMSINGITDARAIPVGYVLRLPVNSTGVKVPDADAPKFTAVEKREMHISKPGGAEKWAFGNVKHWGDFSSIGHAAENSNVDIYGIAVVLVDGDPAAYYMDQAAFGDYATTGKVNNTVGYSHADLAEGHYVESAPTPAPEAEPTPAPAPTPIEVTPPAPEPLPEPVKLPQMPQQYSAPVPTDPKWKESYHDFEDGPRALVAKQFEVVPDFSRLKYDKHVDKDQELEYAGSFVYNGHLLYRPLVSKKNESWFGVTKANLDTEDNTIFGPLMNPTPKSSRAKQLAIVVSATIKRVLLELPEFLKKIKTAKAK